MGLDRSDYLESVVIPPLGRSRPCPKLVKLVYLVGYCIYPPNSRMRNFLIFPLGEKTSIRNNFYTSGNSYFPAMAGFLFMEEVRTRYFFLALADKK